MSGILNRTRVKK